MKSLIATLLLVFFAEIACNAQFFCNAPQAATITNSPSALCDQYQVETMNQQEYQSHPIMEVKVVFHFQGSPDGKVPTYSCGPGVPDEKNISWVLGVLMPLINGILSNPIPEKIRDQPTGNDVIDTRFRFVMHPSSRNSCGTEGVHIYAHGEETVAVPGALNIYCEERDTNHINACKVGGSAGGLITIYNMYSVVNTCKNKAKERLWGYGGTIVHEFLHELNISHAFFCNNECLNIDINPYAHCHSDLSTCGDSWGDEDLDCNYYTFQNNNVMGYGDQQTLTFCQVQKAVREFMVSNKKFPFITPLKTTTQPTVITGKQNWSLGRIILNDIIIEPGASLKLCGHYLFDENVRILVKRGGRLYAESAVLEGLSCSGNTWSGIEVEGNTSISQPDPLPFVDFQTSPAQLQHEAGMVFITGRSVIKETSTACVKNFRYEDRSRQPFPPVLPIYSNPGGLIYATSSTFVVEKGRGIWMQDNPFNDKSIIDLNTFESKDNTKGVGIFLLNMANVNLTSNLFRSLGVGINLSESGANIKGEDFVLPTDHFLNCSMGIYRTSIRDFKFRTMIVDNIQFRLTNDPISIKGGINSSNEIARCKIYSSRTGIFIDGGNNTVVRENLISGAGLAGVHSQHTSGSVQLRLWCNKIKECQTGMYNFGGNEQFTFLKNAFLSNGDNGHFNGTIGFDPNNNPIRRTPSSLIQSVGTGPASNCYDFEDQQDFQFDTPYAINYYVKNGSNMISNSCYQRPLGYSTTGGNVNDPPHFVFVESPQAFDNCGENIGLVEPPREHPSVTRNKINAEGNTLLKNYFIQEKNGNLAHFMAQPIKQNDLASALGMLENDSDFGALKLKHHALLEFNPVESSNFLNTFCNTVEPSKAIYKYALESYLNYHQLRQTLEPDPIVLSQLRNMANGQTELSHYAASALNYMIGEPIVNPESLLRQKVKPIKNSPENSVTESSEIAVFPNPASDNLSIQFTNSTDLSTLIQVFNAEGLMVHSETAKMIADRPFIMDTRQLPIGTYFLRITKYDGNSTFKRFVILR